MSKAKVLRIRNSEFLMNLHADRIETCSHIKNALDISELDFEVLDKVLHQLYNLGFRECKIMERK